MATEVSRGSEEAVDSCSLRGGLADSHLCRKREPGDGCGAVEARRRWAALAKVPCQGPTDRNDLDLKDDFPQKEDLPHFKKHFRLNE